MPKDVVARSFRIARLIEAEGLPELQEAIIQASGRSAWEMRMKGEDGIARGAYVAATGRRVVVFMSFPKKTPKTSRREIETALRRAKEVK